MIGIREWFHEKKRASISVSLHIFPIAHRGFLRTGLDFGGEPFAMTKFLAGALIFYRHWKMTPLGSKIDRPRVCMLDCSM